MVRLVEMLGNKGARVFVYMGTVEIEPGFERVFCLSHILGKPTLGAEEKIDYIGTFAI